MSGPNVGKTHASGGHTAGDRKGHAHKIEFESPPEPGKYYWIQCIGPRSFVECK